jgi:hypothetical protein
MKNLLNELVERYSSGFGCHRQQTGFGHSRNGVDFQDIGLLLLMTEDKVNTCYTLTPEGMECPERKVLDLFSTALRDSSGHNVIGAAGGILGPETVKTVPGNNFNKGECFTIDDPRGDFYPFNKSFQQ